MLLENQEARARYETRKMNEEKAQDRGCRKEEIIPWDTRARRSVKWTAGFPGVGARYPDINCCAKTVLVLENLRAREWEEGNLEPVEPRGRFWRARKVASFMLNYLFVFQAVSPVGNDGCWSSTESSTKTKGMMKTVATLCRPRARFVRPKEDPSNFSTYC